MEPEGSLLCSQQPAIGPHPKSDASSPRPTPYYLRSILILPSYLHLGFPSGPFPSGFTTRVLCYYVK
jgi:hypothetical protein